MTDRSGVVDDPPRDERRSVPEGPGTSDWTLRLTIRAGGWLLRALAMTWRYRVVNDRPWRQLRATGRPFIFAFWHGQLLPLLWLHRKQSVAVVISAHRDGEIVARIAEGLGYRTIRGSSSKGASRALLGLVRALEAGVEVAVTPDGPRGPAERFAPGALVASQRSGAPIVTLAASAAQCWRLRSWDRFMIPKPFARITVAYGDPRTVQAPSAREAEAEAGRFESVLAHLLSIAARD